MQPQVYRLAVHHGVIENQAGRRLAEILASPTGVQGSCDNLRMSEEDLIRAKGTTLDEYHRCRERLRTLEAVAERTAKQLEKVIGFLLSSREEEPFSTGGLEVSLSGELITLLNDLHLTRIEHERLRRLLNVD